MEKIQIKIVIVNFFTEEKKILNLKVKNDLTLIENRMDEIGESLPDCLVVAYFREEIINAHRPHNTTKERDLVLEGKMDLTEWVKKWKFDFISGEQDLPCISPEKEKKVKPRKEIKSEELDSRPAHRAESREIIPSAAGV